MKLNVRTLLRLFGDVRPTLGCAALLLLALPLPAQAQSPLPDSFNPETDGGVFSLAVQADANVSSFALQADGKILVGGLFTTLGGQSRENIGRLNADGTVDTSFNPGAAEAVVSSESLIMKLNIRILINLFTKRCCLASTCAAGVPGDAIKNAKSVLSLRTRAD